MAKLNTGELWEQNYRLRARHIVKGIRISPNGRRNKRATQIFWDHYENNDDTFIKRTEYASSIYLPWEEQSVEKNLKIIQMAIDLSLESEHKLFRTYIQTLAKTEYNKLLTTIASV